MQLFLLGILSGIALSLFFSFGPAFFALLQTSIQHGFRRSIAFPIGICASDVLVVFLMLTLLANVNMVAVIHNPYVAVIGAVAMLVMGWLTFRKKVRPSMSGKSTVKFRNLQKTSHTALFFNGFLINILNPLIWVYWISVIALFSGELEVKPSEMYVFFVGLLATTLGLDILKCKLASMLQRVITAKLLNIFNKVTGCIFFIFAGYLVISMLFYQLGPEKKSGQNEIENPTQSVKVIKKLNQGMDNLPLHRDSSHRE